jgi:hypothetical protein
MVDIPTSVVKQLSHRRLFGPRDLAAPLEKLQSYFRGTAIA